MVPCRRKVGEARNRGMAECANNRGPRSDDVGKPDEDSEIMRASMVLEEVAWDVSHERAEHQHQSERCGNPDQSREHACVEARADQPTISQDRHAVWQIV